MTQAAKYILWIFGGILAIVCLVLLIWSFFRPPVTHGPWPPTPAGAALDAGRN